MVMLLENCSTFDGQSVNWEVGINCNGMLLDKKDFILAIRVILEEGH